nr:SH3 domain-containing protein [uncultured Solibaculum sp.]
MYHYHLAENQDHSYDLIISVDRTHAEFGLDIISGLKNKKAYQDLSRLIRDKYKDIRIKSVKLLVAGVMVASVPFGMFFSAEAAGSKFNMTYLYGGTVSQQIEQVKKVGSFNTVSPSYFDIDSAGKLVFTNISSQLIEEMHHMGVKVVPMLSNHWDRRGGQLALKDPEGMAQQLADAIEKYNLDGVNVDIENVTHNERDAYTRLVARLRELVPRDKEVSVAVAANPNGWNTGWHGSYDYEALGKHADYLMLMAYDEHWQGSEAGPVASIGFVDRSIQYALERVPAEKIVVGVPFFGRIWSEDGNFNGNGVGINTVENIIRDFNAKVTYDQKAQSPKAEFTVREGDKTITINGKRLTPGNYTIWYEDERSLEQKTQLVHKYDLKGLGSWALGQATDNVLGNLSSWLEYSDEGVEGDAIMFGRVTATSLRVREAPTTDSAVIDGLQQGDIVTIVGTQSGWYQVRLPDGRLGFVSALYIEIQPPTTVVTRTGYITGDRVRVRQSAGTNSTILEHVNRGDTVTVHGEEQNGWHHVELANGVKGYVSAEYVSLTQPVVTRTGYITGDRVRVRQSATTQSNILEHVNRGNAVTVYGEEENGWFHVELTNGIKGYVSADYVSFTQTGEVIATSLRIRQSATTDSKTLGYLKQGQTVTILEDTGTGWYRVELPDGLTGYVSADYIVVR